MARRKRVGRCVHSSLGYLYNRNPVASYVEVPAEWFLYYISPLLCTRSRVSRVQLNTLERCPNPYTRPVRKSSLYAKLQRMTLPLSLTPVRVSRPGSGNCVTISGCQLLLAARVLPVTRISEMENSASFDISQEELDALRLEANTWGLLQAVMP